MQVQTKTINFDPNYNFDWESCSNLYNWPSFRIVYADGRMLVFNLKEGTAFEQQEVGGPFYPCFVHQHEYTQAVIESEDECYVKTGDGDLDFDGTLLWERGQLGNLTFTRLPCVNGVPTTAKDKQVMSSVSIRLEGTSFALTEFTWVNGTRWILGTPRKMLDSKRMYYTKNTGNYFTEEIEAIQIPGDFQVTEDLLVHTWKHTKIGTLQVFESTTFDGKKTTRAVLTDQKGREVRLFNTTDNLDELTCTKSRFNCRTGVMNFAHRGRVWTRRMSNMAAH